MDTDNKISCEDGGICEDEICEHFPEFHKENEVSLEEFNERIRIILEGFDNPKSILFEPKLSNVDNQTFLAKSPSPDANKLIQDLLLKYKK